ncbi:MAG TPA: hypothetical protein HPP94_05970 [Desulfuromonadales bacterium]|nr:hypothetical protein [Desulfuromonadales bacterium]
MVLLPPYSPELNPAEQIWNLLRRNYFANRVFDSLDAAAEQAEQGLDKSSMKSLSNWPWINASIHQFLNQDALLLTVTYNLHSRFNVTRLEIQYP